MTCLFKEHVAGVHLSRAAFFHIRSAADVEALNLQVTCLFKKHVAGMHSLSLGWCYWPNTVWTAGTEAPKLLKFAAHSAKSGQKVVARGLRHYRAPLTSCVQVAAMERRLLGAC